MTLKRKPAKPAGPTGMSAGNPLTGSTAGKGPTGKGATPISGSGPKSGRKPKPGPKPKPGNAPAHLPGEPGKAGFTRTVKPIPLPGKSRGR